MALTLAGTGFVTNGVKIGDEVQITLPVGATYYVATQTTPSVVPYTGKFYVTSIISDTSLLFDGFVAGVEQNLSQGNVNPAISVTGAVTTYTMVHTYTKDEQVALIAATAQSYASKRVVLCWPGQAIWEDSDGVTDITLDGSVLAAAFAAACSAYPAQQSFTNLYFTGPKQLLYSNAYFTPSQLDTLSAAGVMVFVQDVIGGQIYARHQKTTSTASIQEQEFSITKAVDKLSIDIYNIVKPFIGKYNINQDLLTQLETNINQYLFGAKNTKASYCGALINSYDSVTLLANLNGQNTQIPVGTIQINLNVAVGYPFNYGPITIFVQ